MIKRVIIYVNIFPDCEEEFLALSSDMVKNSRKSTGCLLYTVYQNFKDITGFCFYFEFSDAQTLHDHFFSQHKKKFMKNIEPMLSNIPRVRIF